MPHTRAAIAARTESLFKAHAHAIHRRTDYLFAALMVIQWIATIAAAIWIAPTTWIGAAGRVHEHVWIALGMGAVLVALPLGLVAMRPGWWLTRQTIALAQMSFSCLLIHITGGRLETHFHIFGSLAILAFYRDSRVLVTAGLLVSVDHCIRGLYLPQSVFGVATVEPWRWLEHAGWMIFEDVFLIAGCAQSIKEMRVMAAERAAIEVHHANTEHIVEDRTKDLRLANAAAERASVAKSNFLANMSHEIRTPMTAILGYTELLLDPSVNDSDRREHALTIRRNGEHLLSIINDILDVSKIEAGRMTVESIPTCPRRVLEEVCSLMNVRAVAKGISLRYETVGELPSCVRTDPTRLRQILLNITGNAIKFTERGGVTLRASFHDGAAPVLRFDVVDTGIGLRAQEIPLLFQAFTQADASTTRRFGGTGLGLSIAQRMARLLGGDITVASEHGKGSVFTVTIAVEVVQGHSESTSEFVVPRQEKPLEDHPLRLAGTRILVAEDGPDNQRLISHHLRKAGAEVELAANGAIGLARALDAALPSFDVILMDMQMPEMDGYEASRRLRENGWTRPIVALTAHAMDGDRERCLKAGCSDFLTKPIDRAAMVDACARWAVVAKANDHASPQAK
jgi:signal transduction histidine kinase/CheY-like chemotaxis protein